MVLAMTVNIAHNENIQTKVGQGIVEGESATQNPILMLPQIMFNYLFQIFPEYCPKYYKYAKPR